MIASKFGIKHSDNKAKVISNVFWALLGKIVNILGVLFVGILVARYLGPSDYGLMNYVISYVSIFSIIANFGLDNIEIRELSKNREQLNSIIGTAFCIRLAFSILTYFLIVSTVVIWETNYFSKVMVCVYAISIITGCCNVFKNYFISVIQNEHVVKSEILRTVIGAVIKIALLWLEAPLEYFIAATAFDALLLSGGYIFSYRKKVGKLGDLRYKKSMVPFLIKESFPLVLSGAAIVIYQRIDQVMIGNMINKESVGYFATAGKFLELILFLPNILVQTVTPILIRKKETNLDEYSVMRNRFVSITVWFSILISCFVSVFSYWLVKLTFGTDYLPAVPVLTILAWKTVGMALSSTSGQLIILEGIQKWAFIRNIFGTILCVGCNLLLIPRFGIIGSAWVTIITVFISGYLSHYLIRPYRMLANVQFKAILLGWKDLVYIKSIIQNRG